MRTTKRFTPDLLDRFRNGGRGHGTYLRYRPWHGVSRGDPSSFGRSHLMMWGGRQRNLLSDDEWVASLFTQLIPGSDDLREQFPLNLESGCHELSAYDARLGKPGFPGSLEIARQLGCRHPRVNGNGRSAPWVITTDLLFTVVDTFGVRKLLAVACKSTAELNDRTKELLAIERTYWAVRDVEWLLITPGQYDEAIELTLRNSFHWGLGHRGHNPCSIDGEAVVLPGADKGSRFTTAQSRSPLSPPYSRTARLLADRLSRSMLLGRVPEEAC